MDRGDPREAVRDRRPAFGIRVLSGIALLAVAATLRPVITALGPVIGMVGRDTGLGAGALGLLGAVPLLAFAVVSPFVNLLSRRFGPDRTVLGASVALLVGTVVRSLPWGTASLWAGTIILGAAI